jgi:hypothetical protein
MDCTLCLDCVHACPYDNIALAARVPGAELADTRRRSGIGRFSRRWDIAALAVIFTFGSLLNAFGMVAPVRGVEAWVSNAIGVASEAPTLAVLFIAALVVMPAVLLGGGATMTKLLADDRQRSIAQISVNYAYALVPLGFGMWLAHYGFHLLTGAFVVVPVTQRAAVDLFGWAALGQPLWRLTGMRPGSVFPIQVGLVLLGTMGSMAAASPNATIRTGQGGPSCPGPFLSSGSPASRCGFCGSRWTCAGLDSRDDDHVHSHGGTEDTE